MLKRIENSFRSLFEDHIREMNAKHEKDNKKHEKGKQLLHYHYEQMAFTYRVLSTKRKISILTCWIVERAQWEERYYRAITPEPKAPEPIVTQEDLLEFLNLVDLDVADINYVLQRRGIIAAGGQDRTEQILKSTQFKDWIVQARSNELLIHGNSDPQLISPLSFFCAMLLRNLRSMDGFISTVFFCGRQSYEDYGGGRTMIMSLLTQILQQQCFDLSFVDHKLAYGTDDGDIEAFCYMFEQLVQRMENTETVFCVIDGINFYERDEEVLQDMAYVLRFLLDMSNSTKILKILITSPSTTEDVRQAMQDADYLALPEQSANTQWFSGLRFERQWGESLGWGLPNV